MNKRSFKAVNWLNIRRKTSGLSNDPSEQAECLAVQSDEITNHFNPNNFLTENWEGETLLSKSGLKLGEFIKSFVKDATLQFKTFHNRNRSTKEAIFEEFLSFANFHGHNQCSYTDPSSFWDQLQQQNYKQDKILDQFIEVYSLRAALIYIYKIRFISQLSKDIDTKLTEEVLFNPSSYINKVFKLSGPTELVSEALQANQYSWYRPSSSLQVDMLSFLKSLDDVSTPEFIKLTNKSAYKNASNCKFSHSFSHKAFGLFINQLLIYLPDWLQGQEAKHNFFSQNDEKRISPLNTSFSGDYLNSMAHSHWLAQEHNANYAWDEIICPEFIGDCFDSGSFLKLSHELKFLTFLVKFARKQSLRPIKLICQVFKDKTSHSKASLNSQLNLLRPEKTSHEILSHRIILNISQLPKKNPHHYVLAQINKKFDDLLPSGMIYVMTNQKLFVPSQSDKIETLLNNFKIEAQLSFEDLKGRGEIPANFYVLRKRSQKIFNKGFLSSIKQNKEETLFSFSFQGDLSQFSKFKGLKDIFKNFLKTKSTLTPIFQKEIDQGTLSFEFHKDAIIEGKLLSSISPDFSKITHPHFFKNLAASCVPFDQFFQIESLSDSTKANSSFIENHLFGTASNRIKKYPLVAIIDFVDSKNINLELIPADSYKAKLNEYGRAFYQYFALTPKSPLFNINIFREFFSTHIGHQIIQLSLNGGTTKLKSKLKSVLIPNFFFNNETLPQHLEKAMDLCQLTVDQIFEKTPVILEQEMVNMRNFVSSLSDKYPTSTIGNLSHFKFNLQNALQKLDQKTQRGTTEVNYHNPRIIAPLMALNSTPIYPQNPDVYVEIKCLNTKDLYLPLTGYELKKKDDQYFLELQSETRVIIELYSDPELLNFIKFIFSATTGQSIFDLLQRLSIPPLDALKKVLSEFRENKKVISALLEETDTLISKIFSEKISSPKVK